MEREPEIIINGHELSIGQAMTVRIALQMFSFDLNSESESGAALRDLYLDRIREVNQFILESEEKAQVG